MTLLMLMAASPPIMGPFRISGQLHVLGWVATAVMLLAAIG
jgi:hypothetical protein